MPEVRIIQPIAEQAKKQRVAAYARVSSDSADQLNSFATQVEYYTSTILFKISSSSYKINKIINRWGT